MFYTRPLLYIAISIVIFASLADTYESDVFTNIFAVEIVGDNKVAHNVASEHGFRIVRNLESVEGVYEFLNEKVSRRSKRSTPDAYAGLSADPRVLWVEQQKVLYREKRDLKMDKDEKVDLRFNDPYYKHQWYLFNKGQTGGVGGHDINVLPAWRQGLSGKGVVVTIVDDGIDHAHPDLRRNYDSQASADLNDPDDPFNDPTPNMTDPNNNHGTRCAGAVAAVANNSICGVGVAFNAKIGGIRMLDGVITDMVESSALSLNTQHIDIYSSSWGPKDNGMTMDGPRRYTRKSLENGIRKGRKGKGSIFVWATGNGGRKGDDCNCDGYITSPYTIAVGSITDRGMSTEYTEVCPSTIAVAFTSGSKSSPNYGKDTNWKSTHVVTTDVGGKCTVEFQGTSTAAPLASGCIALILEANPMLTWRDVQHIFAETSVAPNEVEDGWVVNGGGYHVNHRFGFGAIDCSRMVEAARDWKLLQEARRCVVKSDMKPSILMGGGSLTKILDTDGCQHPAPYSSSVDTLDQVRLHINMTHVRRGDVSIDLTSPSGTTSHMLKVRPNDKSAKGINFIFKTVHNWGESSKGEWTLVIKDNSDPYRKKSKVGELISWTLILYGVKGKLENNEKWRMSDGYLMKDGRLGGTKVEKRRRMMEQLTNDEFNYDKYNIPDNDVNLFSDEHVIRHVDDDDGDGSDPDNDRNDGGPDDDFYARLHRALEGLNDIDRKNEQLERAIRGRGY